MGLKLQQVVPDKTAKSKRDRKKSANSAKKQKNKSTLLLQFYNSFNFIL